MGMVFNKVEDVWQFKMARLASNWQLAA